MQCMDGVKRIIHTSSVAAIRSTDYKNGKIFSRKDWCDDATETRNAYGFAKAEAERIMREWAKDRDVRLVTIHPSIVFGPYCTKGTLKVQCHTSSTSSKAPVCTRCSH